MGVFLASAVSSIPHPNLSQREVRVLIEFAKHCNDESGTRKNGKKFVVGGDCHPAQADVAYHLHMYRQAVNTDVRTLVKIGWLIPDGKYGNYMQYKFNMNMLVRCIDATTTLDDIRKNMNVKPKEFLRWQESIMEKARGITRDDGYGDKWFPGYKGRILQWESKDGGIVMEMWRVDSQNAHTPVANDGVHHTTATDPAHTPSSGCMCNCSGKTFAVNGTLTIN